MGREEKVNTKQKTQDLETPIRIFLDIKGKGGRGFLIYHDRVCWLVGCLVRRLVGLSSVIISLKCGKLQLGIYK